MLIRSANDVINAMQMMQICILLSSAASIWSRLPAEAQSLIWNFWDESTD